MAKTQEELNALKEEVEALNKKLHELTEEELKQVSGGVSIGKMKKIYCVECGYVECTFPEGMVIGGMPDERCPQCGAENSFAIGDA